MKVLFPIEGDGGGAVTHVLMLAKTLPKEKIQTFVAFLTSGPSVQVANKLGLNGKLISKKFVLDPILIWRLTKIMSDEKIDIVHTHTIRGNFYARIASVLSQRAMMSLTSVHSFIVDELKGSTEDGLRNLLLAKRELYTSKLVDHFIPVSDKIKGRLLESGIPDSKITVIENGVEMPDLSLAHIHDKSVRKEFSIDHDEAIIGIVGRLVPLKNHSLFLEAARRVLNTNPSTKFLVVGDGVLLNSLKNKAKDLNIDKNVIFTGWRNDVQRLLCAVDIYTICSLIEGMNISVLEAMACAKPVIGTRVKGISEIVLNNETGFLVPSSNVTSLAEAMIKLINDREMSRKMGLKGRQLVEKNYSVDKMIQKIVNLYEDLLCKRTSCGK